MRLKRAFDVAMSLALLTTLSPLMFVIALAVRLTTRGPALFRQERMGRHGKTFRIHKFRSMKAVHDGALVSPTGDARVTRVGAVLRRTKLDELPQLIDVLLGDMSMVGPRPEVPEYAAQWLPEHRDVILSVRPGITDPASLAFRHEADVLASAPDPHRYYSEVLLPEKSAMYVEYVRNRSFLGDLLILLRTARSVVD